MQDSLENFIYQKLMEQRAKARGILDMGLDLDEISGYIVSRQITKKWTGKNPSTKTIQKSLRNLVSKGVIFDRGNDWIALLPTEIADFKCEKK